MLSLNFWRGAKIDIWHRSALQERSRWGFVTAAFPFVCVRRKTLLQPSSLPLRGSLRVPAAAAGRRVPAALGIRSCWRWLLCATGEPLPEASGAGTAVGRGRSLCPQKPGWAGGWCHPGERRRERGRDELAAPSRKRLGTFLVKPFSRAALNQCLLL